ncbi:MAG: 4-alpha-glucanotransferase [Omnitrophica WOR_2 bacterium]
MKFKRASGVILHPTSLPGPYGIGDIGPQAHRWLKFMAESGIGLWQVLPLGPTGYGDSPYQCFSAFAGNPYLVSPDVLLDEGLLTPDDVQNLPGFSTRQVEYGEVIHWKLSILEKAFQHFLDQAPTELQHEFKAFQQGQAFWLEDYALFMAIKESQEGKPWSQWPDPLRKREPAALEQARNELRRSILSHAFRQFLFFRQWSVLRDEAARLGITIIGDIPIFVAHDSADVWSNLNLFYMDKDGNPTVVAGVPPDYFSPTGQLWGNPLYRWDVHASTGYAWWLQRFRAVLKMVDIVRLDHFRGFAGYWEVPAGNMTAEHGKWVPGPGKDFLQVIKSGLGELPIIAEDLGVITPDVEELRDAFGLPGMKVLQFAFYGNPDDAFLPHNYPRNCVAYTGTHDNDTSAGWFTTRTQAEKEFCLSYIAGHEQDISWDMIRSIWSSVAMFALAPMQDFLALGSEARMNFPGKPAGNWTWRMCAGDLSEDLCQRIKKTGFLYSRLNSKS